MDAASPRHRQKARQSGGRRSSAAEIIRCLMARGGGYGEIVAYLDDALFEARQQAVTAIVRADR
jgi:hypothetical protein